MRPTWTWPPHSGERESREEVAVQRRVASRQVVMETERLQLVLARDPRQVERQQRPLRSCGRLSKGLSGGNLCTPRT